MPALDTFPRARFNFLPTPLVEMQRLPRLLCGPRIFIKRDDLTGPALGGNKTRKLEFLLGEALAQGRDAVLACGAIQSNLCRQTAGAAAAVGLPCHLALGGSEPPQAEGNLLLDRLLGAHIHWCGPHRKGEDLPRLEADLRAAGLNPYVVTYGGSTEVGALGFVAAMEECRGQLEALGVRIDHLIIPSSSRGTQAGMAVGAARAGLTTRIVGIGIDPDGPAQALYAQELADLANRIEARLDSGRTHRPEAFHLDYGYMGAGYEVVSDAVREAVKLTAAQEGILLDPIYSGRAMAGLIGMIRKGQLGRDDTVLFWHTGGVPALFGFARELA